MNKFSRNLALIPLALCLFLLSGCMPPPDPQPLKYVALEKPTGPIKCEGQSVEKKFSRSGPYFLNVNFRPAPDIGNYVQEMQNISGSKVLKNADVKLRIPFAFDILLFGFQFGDDKATAKF